MSRWLACAVIVLAALSVSAPSEIGAESLSDLTFTMLREVKRLRGLEPKATVGIGTRDPKALISLLHRRIAEDYEPAELEALDKLLKLTGLVPADYRLVERYVALLASQALGFYDFKSETFFLSTQADPTLHAAVVLHELTHALQDQHFHIYLRLKALEDDEDARTALQSLIEGEATAVMLDLALEPAGRRFYSLTDEELAAQTGGEQGAFKGEPPVMRDFLYFPYEAGLVFVKDVRRRMPWPKVDELYASPPASTEQVLHPERYLLKPDRPRSVAWPDLGRALGRAWKVLDSNVLGELGAYLLIKYSAPTDLEAREAAAGWGGDRYLVVEKRGGGRAVALLLFAWDTERDAREFQEAYRRAASKRAADGEMEPGPGGAGLVVRQALGLTYLERRVDNVLIIEGVEAGEIEGFRRLGWAARISFPSKDVPPTEGLARREKLRREAESLIRVGDLDGAADAARRALELSPDDAEALYLAGRALASREETLAEGLDYLTHATNRDPSFGPALVELGLVLLDLQLTDEALAALKRANAILPDHLGSAQALAEALLEEGSFEAASETLKPFSEGLHGDPALLTLLGRIALGLGNLGEARRQLTASLGAAPSAEAHLALGRLDKEEGRNDAAEEHFLKALESDESDVDSLLALGGLYMDGGRTAEAAR